MDFVAFAWTRRSVPAVIHNLWKARANYAAARHGADGAAATFGLLGLRGTHGDERLQIERFAWTLVDWRDFGAADDDGQLLDSLSQGVILFPKVLHIGLDGHLLLGGLQDARSQLADARIHGAVVDQFILHVPGLKSQGETEFLRCLE